MKIGDFVSVKGDVHIGLVMGFSHGCAQILWLTKDCHNTVHWSEETLTEAEPPKDIDWMKIAVHAGMWFNNMIYFEEKYYDKVNNPV